MKLPLEGEGGARRQTMAVAALGLIATVLVLPADGWLLSALASVRSEGGRQVMLALTQLGHGGVDFGLAAVAILAGWALGRSHLVQAGLRAAVAVAAAGIAVQLIKHVACRARPDSPGGGAFFHDVPCLGAMWGFFSFPSGHAATATALAVALGLRVPALRLPAAAGVVVVMASRVYLGAHFPSDVMAGATLGAVAGVLAASPGNPPGSQPAP
ncbi:MAG TPA: phosphatase PAP2 family protein [Candidatus Methylomirabilis sp.]|jgi:undecaprenyl-diphosphatase